MNFKLDYTIINNSSDTIYVVSKAGFRYPIIKNNDDQWSTLTPHNIIVTLQDVDLNKLTFCDTEYMTSLDRAIVDALKAKLKEFLDAYYKSTGSYNNIGPRTLIANVMLEGVHSQEGGEIKSEMLGISIWKGSDYRNAPPTSGPVRLAHELVSKNVDEGLVQPDSAELLHVEHGVVTDSLEEPSAMHWGIFVNDPKNIFNTMWVNMMGKAMPLPVTRDSNVPAGIYSGLRGGKNKPEAIYYDFDVVNSEEITKLGVFTSKQEALKGGNSERYLIAEERIGRLEKESYGLKRELESKTIALGKQEILNSRLNWEILHTKTEAKLKDLVGKIVCDKVKPNKESKGDNMKNFLDFISQVTRQITNHRRLAL